MDRREEIGGPAFDAADHTDRHSAVYLHWDYEVDAGICSGGGRYNNCSAELQPLLEIEIARSNKSTERRHGHRKGVIGQRTTYVLNIIYSHVLTYRSDCELCACSPIDSSGKTEQFQVAIFRTAWF